MSLSLTDFTGYVREAGGGEVAIVVDRSADEYPPEGTRVRVIDGIACMVPPLEPRELGVMYALLTTLQQLDADERRRVLWWLNARFGGTDTGDDTDG